MDSPCGPWATTSDVPADVRARIESVEGADVDGILREVLIAATLIVWAATGRRWAGACEARTLTFDVATIPAGTADLVELPGWPVREVTGVAVDGVPLLVGWRLINGRWLQRTTTTGLGMVSTLAWAGAGRELTVTYVPGADPPAGGARAVGVLAGQFALGMAGDASCQLPQRVQSITRQGVTIAVLDPMDFLADGLTGIAEVDMWIRAVNPLGLRSRPMVWTPETAPPRAWEVTGP